METGHGKTGQQAGNETAYRVASLDFCSRQPVKSQVAGIHKQEGDHQQQNERQGHDSVDMRFGFHFRSAESFHIHEAPADCENNDRDTNEQGKNISCSHQHIMYWSQKTE